MEKELNGHVEDLMKQENVLGVAVSDPQGLSFAVIGEASEASCGLWATLHHEARKLEPKSDFPIVVLEDTERRCSVIGNDKVVITIYEDQKFISYK